MKENIIDVLLFLFDNCQNFDGSLLEDEMALALQLEEAGFHISEITKAFHWLDELATVKNNGLEITCEPSKTFRLYSSQEQARLSAPCRGFLQKLEQMGVLDPSTRELIIERAVAIQADRLTLAQFKRITGLILFNQIQSHQVLAWLEDFIYDDLKAVLH